MAAPADEVGGTLHDATPFGRRLDDTARDALGASTQEIREFALSALTCRLKIPGRRAHVIGPAAGIRPRWRRSTSTPNRRSAIRRGSRRACAASAPQACSPISATGADRAAAVVPHVDA